jgi:hypothetical protein
MWSGLEPLQDRLGDVFGFSTAQKQQFNRAAVEMRRSGLPAKDVGVALTAYVDDAAATMRGAEVDVAQRTQGWKEESRRQLREGLGKNGWNVDDLAQRVETFVNTQPRLKEALATNGLMYRPDIYASLVEHVRKLR